MTIQAGELIQNERELLTTRSATKAKRGRLFSLLLLSTGLLATIAWSGFLVWAFSRVIFAIL